MTDQQKLSALASDVDVALEAYQLALGNGNLFKIAAAKRFWCDCDADYQKELRRQIQMRARNWAKQGRVG